MALSNWDSLSFGPDGKPSNGVFESVKGSSSIEIYKNWVYLRNPKMWQERSSYTKPTIAEIQSADISFDTLVIKAERHDSQNAVFVFASEFIYEEGKPSNSRYFAGIGCYGFKDEVKLILKKLGRLKDYEKFMWSTSSEYNGQKATQHFLHGSKEDKHGKYDLKKSIKIPYKAIPIEKLWEGVNKTTIKAFWKWLDSMVVGDKEALEWAKACKESGEVAYNQGNAYFAKALNVPIPAETAPILIKKSKKALA